MIHYEALRLGENYCQKFRINTVNSLTVNTYAFFLLRFTSSPSAITAIAPTAPAIRL